jgi:hypothetical protein
MKKKSLIMLLGTLIVGIIIGSAGMGIYSHMNSKSIFEVPSKEKFIQRTTRMLDPDAAQLKQIQPIIDRYSEKAYLLTKEHSNQMFTNFNSMYVELMPYLNDKQKEKIDKKINHIKSIIQNNK